MVKEQLDNLLLVLVTRQCSCHMQSCVAMCLMQWKKKKMKVGGGKRNSLISVPPTQNCPRNGDL